jgi:hypothetical protein
MNRTATFLERASAQLAMPTCAALAAVLVFIPLVINPNTDFLYLFLIVPGLLVLGICALIYAAIRKTRIAVMVATFWVVSALLFVYNIPIRSFTRWLLWSRQYKSEVLAEPASKNGDLKHIEWDGWGWGGQEFSVFLVFDPADSLSGPAKNGQWGRLNGIPCEVSRVRRMDSHWYIVFFDGYVSQSSWGSCK